MKPLTMKVVVEYDSKTRQLDDIIEINRDNNTYNFTNIYDEEICIDKKWSIVNVKIYDLDVNVNDWVKYIDNDRIEKGKVSEVRNDEIIVKQLPDGWQVAVSKHQILESKSDV